VSKESARAFVLAFDKAYQRNKIILDGGPRERDLASVNLNNSGVVKTADVDDGIVIGVTGWLSGTWHTVVTEDGETRTAEGEFDDWYGAWYHLQAHRLTYLEPSNEIAEDDNIPSIDQFWTVYCH
jgi:hypothetical protein